jgi:uncharacterized protein
MGEAPGLQEGQDGLVTEVLSYAASQLVEHADEVRVSFEPGEPPIYRLLVHEDDLGRIIGRNGRTARALRGVARAAAAKSGVRVMIRIGDDED